MRRTPNNLVFGALLFAVSFGLFAGLLYGGVQLVKAPASAETDAGDNAGSQAGGPVSVTIVARDLKFDKRSITASADASVTVTLDNQDAGVLHNIAFYTNSRATDKIAGGDTITGPSKIDVTFTAPSRPANYYFRCDVHPDSMNGAFSVK